MTAPAPLRIALADYTTAVWTASFSFTRMLGLSLSAACAESGAEVGVLSKRGTQVGNLPVWPMRAPRYLPGERLLRRKLGRAEKSSVAESARAFGIRVVVPVLDFPEPVNDFAAIGWVPDLQYHVLPEFFTAAQRAERAAITRRLVRNTTRILLSSEASRRDLLTAEPAYGEKFRVIPFPSLFAFEPPVELDASVRARYRLPEKFLLVANQFWAHKNHAVVIEAVRLLAARGIAISVVMTGLPLDPRDPSNEAISRVLQGVASAGVGGLVTLLGAVPFPELVSLLRLCAAVVQPSRSEGWSTTVQDARALGRPLFCADLPVLREQAPDALGFFGCDDPEALAQSLSKHWEALSAGPHLDRESAALTREQAFAREHGTKLFSLCREAVAALG